MRMSATQKLVLDTLIDRTVLEVTTMSANNRLALFTQPKPASLWPLILQVAEEIKIDPAFAARLQSTVILTNVVSEPDASGVISCCRDELGGDLLPRYHKRGGGQSNDATTPPTRPRLAS